MEIIIIINLFFFFAPALSDPVMHEPPRSTLQDSLSKLQTDRGSGAYTICTDPANSFGDRDGPDSGKAAMPPHCKFLETPFLKYIDQIFQSLLVLTEAAPLFPPFSLIGSEITTNKKIA